MFLFYSFQKLNILLFYLQTIPDDKSEEYNNL